MEAIRNSKKEEKNKMEDGNRSTEGLREIKIEIVMV